MYGGAAAKWIRSIVFCSNIILYEVQSHTSGEDLFVGYFVNYSVSLINVINSGSEDSEWSEMDVYVYVISHTRVR